MGWCGERYAECLAAWYPVQQQRSLQQRKSLIGDPDDPEEKLVPQLHECAAWLAGMMPDVFRTIVQCDPQVLLRSDVATADVDDRARLVSSLLRSYDDEKLLDRDLDVRRLYYKLKY